MMLIDKECREWHDRLNPLKQGQQPLKETSCGETVQREGNKASGAYTFFEESQDNVLNLLNLLAAKLVKE